MCGTDFTDIDSAIIETERFIKNIHTDGIKIIEDIETQITNLFQKRNYSCVESVSWGK